MQKTLARCFVMAFSGLARSAGAWSQAIPAATKPLTAQAGRFAVARSGYVYNYIKGYTVYGDVDYHRRIGIEAELHLTDVYTPDDIGGRSILIGPRLTLLHGGFNGRSNFVSV